MLYMETGTWLILRLLRECIGNSTPRSGPGKWKISGKDLCFSLELRGDHRELIQQGGGTGDASYENNCSDQYSQEYYVLCVRFYDQVEYQGSIMVAPLLKRASAEHPPYILLLLSNPNSAIWPYFPYL